MNTTTAVDRKIQILLADNVSPIDIMYCLALRGISQADIAREAGVSKVTVHQVLWNKERSVNVASLIAAKLDTTLTTLWGSTYAYRLKRSERSAHSHAA